MRPTIAALAIALSMAAFSAHAVDDSHGYGSPRSETATDIFGREVPAYNDPNSAANPLNLAAPDPFGLGRAFEEMRAAANKNRNKAAKRQDALRRWNDIERFDSFRHGYGGQDIGYSGRNGTVEHGDPKGPGAQR